MTGGVGILFAAMTVFAGLGAAGSWFEFRRGSDGHRPMPGLRAPAIWGSITAGLFAATLWTLHP